MPGEYTIMVHYFSANRNLLGGETHVQRDRDPPRRQRRGSDPSGTP